MSPSSVDFSKSLWAVRFLTLMPSFELPVKVKQSTLSIWGSGIELETRERILAHPSVPEAAREIEVLGIMFGPGRSGAIEPISFVPLHPQAEYMGYLIDVEAPRHYATVSFELTDRLPEESRPLRICQPAFEGYQGSRRDSRTFYLLGKEQSLLYTVTTREGLVRGFELKLDRKSLLAGILPERTSVTFEEVEVESPLRVVA